MAELLLALIPILTNAGGLDAALGAMTFAEWLGIGVKAAEAGPDVMTALAKLHPALETFMADLTRTRNPETAAKTMQQWFAANADAAINLQPGAAGQ